LRTNGCIRRSTRWRGLIAGLCLAAALPAERAADASPASPAAPRAERVILISIDGLRADALTPEAAPTLINLAARGACCPVAETIRPSITLPSHTSMITGLDYARHGVTWNDYRPGILAHPTILTLAHDAGLSTAMLYGKSKFEYLAVPGTVDWMVGEPPPPSFALFGRTIFPTRAFGVLVVLHLLAVLWIWFFLGAARRELRTPAAVAGVGESGQPGRALLLLTGPVVYAVMMASLVDVPVISGCVVRGELSRIARTRAEPDAKEDAAAAAKGLAKAFAREWPSHPFALTFIHFRDPDEAGHRSGWMGPAYMKSIATCDSAVKTILDAVRDSGLEATTTVLVTADHGGSGRRHYKKSEPDKPEHVRIPWICAGAGAKTGVVIDRVVHVYDTMPTVLTLLGIAVPEGIDGRVVVEALK
jgi:hypothetical protein